MGFGQEGYNQENVSGFQAHAGGLHSEQTDTSVESKFLTQVFGWLSLGLAVTAVTSFAVLNSQTLIALIFGSGLFWGLIIGELALVWYLSSRIFKMSTGAAGTAFFVYSLLNGITLTPILHMYTGASIASTFVVCAGTFGATALYGYTTKKDLSSMGGLLMMALIGLIIASVVNIFLGSSLLYWGLTVLGIVIFVGLTAYDMQKIKDMSRGHFAGGEMGEKASILGALTLYLDFINLFIMLLRLLGDRD